VESGKSVIVRINDRGPFVVGRDMDLSLAAFTAIENRRKGHFQARFERLGDHDLVEHQTGPEDGTMVDETYVILQSDGTTNGYSVASNI
jgi:rare lipoprotein A